MHKRNKCNIATRRIFSFSIKLILDDIKLLEYLLIHLTLESVRTYDRCDDDCLRGDDEKINRYHEKKGNGSLQFQISTLPPFPP